MANKYPHIGHNSNTVTTNNGDNQPITPHSSHLWVSSTQPNQIATTALKTAGKSSLASFISFRKTGAVIWVLLVLLAAWAPFGNAQTPTQIQEITWNNDIVNGTNYTFYPDDCCNGNYFTITENSNNNDYNKWVKFTAPFGCKIKITLRDNNLGHNNTRFDYIYYNQGTIEPNNTSYSWNSNTAINGTANVWTTISSNSIAIKFQNTNNAGNSKFQIRVETVGCADCICSSSIAVPTCFEFDDYADPSDSEQTDSGLPQCWSRVYRGTNVGYAPHVYNGATYGCDGSNGIIMGARRNNAIGNTSVVILPLVTGMTTGTQISYKYKFARNDREALELGYVNGRTFTRLKQITRTNACTNDSYTLTAADATAINTGNRRLAFRYTYDNDNNSGVFIDHICIQNSNSCSTDPDFTNCPSSLESGTTWNPHWNTSATPTGWTTSNASYSAGTVTAGSTIGNASVSATVAEDMPYCAGTLRCTFNVVCNTSRSLTLSSASGTVVAGNDITATITNTTGQTINWTTDNGHATASQSGNTLTIHGVSEGPTTITGTIPQWTDNNTNITYCEKTVTYTVEVNDGCAKTGGMDGYSGYTPFFGGGNHSWCQMLYTASELGNQSCHINKIAFYVSTAVNYNFPTRIYMKLVNQTTFDSDRDFVAMSDDDLVWSGTWNTSTTGWNEIELQTPFAYDRDYVLLIGVKCDGRGTSPYPRFQYSSTTGYTTIYAYNYGSEPNISNIGNWGTAGDLPFHPYMKICMDCCNINATIQIGNQ